MRWWRASVAAVHRACFQRLIALAAIPAAALLPGCMVGPDYQRPEVELNDAWMEGGGAAEDTGVNLRWWETFNDPVLNDLVAEALEQNLGLRAAGLRVIEARALRGIAVGRFFPQTQQAFGGVAHNELSENAPLAGVDTSFADAAVGFDVAWELDFWGRFRRGIESADAELLASVADYDTVLVTLAADVASNYVLARSLQERIVITRRNVALQTETLQLTEARFNAGAVSELDVTTARATLANTQALTPELEDALRQVTLALGVLLGRPPSDLQDLLASNDGETARVPEAPPEIALGVPADLLRRRPDVRSAERLAAAQSARIGEATTDLFPSISIGGSTGFLTTDAEGVGADLGNLFDANSFTGFVGLQVNWPILNYGRIQGNIRAQDARFEQAAVRYQDVVLRAAADVEGGLSSFLRSRERTTYLSESASAAERSAELSLIQYRAGAVDFIRVNDAQTVLVEVQDRLVSSRASTSLAAIQTYRALGGGWEVRAGREFVDRETAERMRQRTNWGDVLAPDWEEGKDLGFKRPALASEATGETE
jgi:NodT family efflux transporter outer membrane factor (OMF) lipoprotein